MNRIFRFYFGAFFLLFGLIISLFHIRWGYAFLFSAIICEIFSYVGDRRTDKKFREHKVQKKARFRVHHLHTGAGLVVLSFLFISKEWWDLFFSFSMAMFLHDALYHLCVYLFKVDSEWQKKYLPRE